MLTNFRIICLNTWLFAVLWPLQSVAVSASSGVKYTAAVFEHHPEQSFVIANKSDALTVVKKNLDEYEQMAAEARTHGADIIVFPEDGIDGLLVYNISMYAEAVPSLDDIVQSKIVPCTDYSEETHLILWRLSCMALNHGMAVVANMADHNVSTGHFFNTDVAFDTDGRLLMKYHKQHLFFEKSFTPGSPSPSHLPVFRTSFGVTFGMCTCYDILFPNPCHQVVLAAGATDLAFPTAWMNAGPLLYSIGIQQAFSAVMNVNVLAANLHWPLNRFTGSGIFAAGGQPVQVFMSQTAGFGRLLVAPLTSGPERPRSPLSLEKVPTLPSEAMPEKITSAPYKFKLVHPDETSTKSCYFDFCCSISYNLNEAEGEVFAIGAYEGLKAGQPVKYRMEACALVRCTGSTLATCADATPEANVTSEFEHFTISAQFDASVNKTRMYPVVMTSGGGLADFTESVKVEEKSGSDGIVWSLSAVKPLRISTAGLFAHPALPHRH